MAVVTNNPINPNDFPRLPPAAGAGPVVPRQFELGNEDLIAAVTEKLGGSIPPGTTMTAKYDRDKTSHAIQTTIHQGKEKYDAPFITFWRTFTVNVPGQGEYHFRKQIFTNISIPPNCSSNEFQNRLELATLACSAYSKICNDAILVKGGGKSMLNLDESKIDQIQKKTFIELGMKLADLKNKKVSSLDKIHAKVGDTKITFNLNEVKPGKLTSMHTRHKKFTIKNPPLAYVKDRAKTLQKMLDNPIDLVNDYMDGGKSDSAKALKDLHEKRTTYKVIGEIKKSGVVTARRLCSGDQHPTVRAAYASLGSDIQRTINDIKAHREKLSMDKPETGWKRERFRLGRQQSQLEAKLRKMQNEWPGLSQDIGKEANAKFEPEHAKAEQFRKEAADANVQPHSRNNFVEAKVASEMADASFKDLESQIAKQKLKLDSVQAEIAKGGPNELMNPLQAQAEALDKLIKTEEAKLNELQLIKEAAAEEEKAAKESDGSEDYKKILAESETKRIQAQDQFGDDRLANAKEAYGQAERAVTAARKKIAEDAAIAKKAVEDKYKKEAVDLNIHEPLHADFINKKISIENAKASLEAKKKEVQVLQEAFAKTDGESKDPRNYPELRTALEKHAAVQKALVEDAEKAVKIAEMKIEASELDLKELTAKGADEDFKKSGKPSAAAQLNIDLILGQKKTKLEEADNLAKSVRTEELKRDNEAAFRAVDAARANQADAIKEAKARWENEINQQPEGENKDLLKAIYEDVVNCRQNIVSLQGKLNENAVKHDEIQARISREVNPAVKEALQEERQLLEQLRKSYSNQLKAEQSILNASEEELLHIQQNGYAMERERLKKLEETQAPFVKVQEAAKFNISNLEKLAEQKRAAQDAEDSDNDDI